MAGSYHTRQVLVSDVLQVEPGYGYSICMGRPDWEEVIAKIGDEYSNAAEVVTMNPDLTNLCVHMDASEIATVFEAISSLDLEGR
jgi:hypothetical protein